MRPLIVLCTQRSHHLVMPPWYSANQCAFTSSFTSLAPSAPAAASAGACSFTAVDQGMGTIALQLATMAANRRGQPQATLQRTIDY
eukprot:m.3239 g.3239  ORF g.3239 m.3239 type:complete len:86 (+) comp4783_c0_seq2:522-779(+)